MDHWYSAFLARNLSLGMDEALTSEIAEADPVLAGEVQTLEQALGARRGAVEAAAASGDWSAIASLPPSPATRLEDLAATIQLQAATLEQAGDDAARAKLEMRFAELDARQELAKIRPIVLATLEQFSTREKLSACLAALKTNSISLKSTELAEKVISKDLGDALNAEFKSLGAGRLQVQLETRSVVGEPLHRLVLKLPQVRRPSEIFSEGEQRAIAIGSFLAEVNLSGSTGAMCSTIPCRRSITGTEIGFQTTRD